MKKHNRSGMTIAIALIALSSAASAESWICEQGELMREIVVQREGDAPAPCQVIYNKETENQGSQVLWSAQFDGAYCDAQADAFAEKLSGWGWSCEAFNQE